jgi:hypothetical protein
VASPISHDPSFWAAVETIKSSREKRLCLAASASDACRGRIIAAHTIPRSQLSLIAEAGHVYTFAGDLPTFQKTGGRLELVKKGIGTFSVLNCFCAHHDTTLFSSIENHPFADTSEQIACLNYRAVAAELYRKMTALTGFEEVFSKSLKGKKRANAVMRKDFARQYIHGTKLGLVDIGKTFRHSEESLFGRLFDNVSALVIRFRMPPTIMSVGGFSPQFDYDARRLQNLSNESVLSDQISLSIISSDGKATIVFTWLKNANAPKLFAKSFASQRRELYTTLIIQTAFEHLENTCMKMSWWEAMRPIERELLKGRMQVAIGPTSRDATALTYAGVTFDDWGYESHRFVNVD